MAAMRGAEIQDADGIALILDMIESEEHGLEATVTRYPIEDGADGSDHYKKGQDTLTLVGRITNTPMDPELGRPDRDFRGYDELRFLMELRELVVVVTQMRTYRNMAIERVITARDANLGQSIQPSIEFRQVEFATQETVTIPARILDPTVKNKAASERDKGRQGTAAANAETETKGKSILAGLIGLAA